MERKVAVSNLEQNKEAENSEEKENKPVEEPSTENDNSDSAQQESENTEVTPQDENAEESPEVEAASSEAESVDENIASEEPGEKSEAEEKVIAEEKNEAVSIEEEAPEETTEEGEDNTAYYKKITEKAQELIEQNDWAFVNSELAVLAQNIEEGPDSSAGEAKKFIDEFQKLRSDFEERKKAHYEELNRKKQENLTKKKELLKSLSEIVSEENWTATKEVSQIKGKWESIKQLPQGEAETLNERFAALMEEFEDHKVDRLVKKLQKEEENLELKLLLLDKMDVLNEKLQNEEADFERLNKEFEDLLAQWRKVGRVPAEKNQALWDRYHASQETFNEKRFKYDAVYRKSIEKALNKKKKLIKEAEALVDHEDLAQAARKVNKLHKAWKKAGNLPQREENEMWDLFKAATDAFNEKKSENIDQLREQEDENLEKKLELISKAEEFKDTEDFDKGHQQMQNLMNEWKKIGPVPRKKSSKIWKKFKGAMDEFYEKRRESFKEQRQDQKENLAKKQEILTKLEELGKHEDPALAVEEAKKLQQEFKDAGHVPIKMKNKIWKQYREACDVIYERYRSLGADLGMEKKLAKAGVEPGSRKEVIKYQKEASRLKKEISVLESDIIQFQEAKTYFKPTNKGNVLRDELQEKIDKAEKALEEKQDRMYELEKQIDQLTDSENK